MCKFSPYVSVSSTSAMKYSLIITREYADGAIRHTVEEVKIGIFDGPEYFDCVLCKHCTIEVKKGNVLIERYHR